MSYPTIHCYFIYTDHSHAQNIKYLFTVICFFGIWSTLNFTAIVLVLLLLLLLLLLLCPFNGLFSRTTWVSQHQKGKPFWILLEQEMMRWQWHQLDHMQIRCPSSRPNTSVTMLNGVVCGIQLATNLCVQCTKTTT